METPGSDSERDLPRKPISVRDAVAGRSPGPPPTSPQRGRRRIVGREGSRVRDGLQHQDGRRIDAGVAPPPDETTSPVWRTFSEDDAEWTVRVVGAGRAGTSPDRGVALMHLTFSRGVDAGPERELLCAGRRIDSLAVEELRALLGRSRPVREDSSGGV